MNKKVAEYFEKQASPQKEICKKLRSIIIKTFPGISEEMKWGAPVYDGGKFYIAAVRQGVNLGFSVEGLTAAEMNRFRGKGTTMRHIKILTVKDIDEREIVELLGVVKKD